jgi:RHS repeat-associated protein
MMSDGRCYLAQGFILHCWLTSKERDAETGLDYFGARYYSGAQGRFTSVDPLLNSGRPDNPQSWNRYSYTFNNPLRYTDPLGLYVWGDCSGNEEECAGERQRFRDSITEAQKALTGLDPESKEAKKLKKTLDRIGEEGKGNIEVGFGDLGKDMDGSLILGLTQGNKITIDYGNIDRASNSFNLSEADKPVLDAGITVHEGAHSRTLPRFLGQFFMGGESSAYYNQSVMYQGLHYNDPVFKLWNDSWLAVDQDKFPVDKTRNQAIQHILHPKEVQAPTIPATGGQQ